MKYIISIIISLALIGTISWWLIQNDSSENVKVVSKQYICPMHPQITSTRPIACPICGMDLVLVTDEGNKEHHSAVEKHGNVHLSLRKQQMIGVVTAKVKRKKLFKSIRLPGRIAFDPELYTAQSEYLNALKQWRRVKKSPSRSVVENTRQMIQSSKIRLKVLGLSDGQIRELKRRGSQTEGLLLSGRGQDNWIYADVFEMELPWMKKGLKAKIGGRVLHGKILDGKIISVDQVINPHTRTAKVRIQLISENISLRPESYVEVTIFSPLGEQTAVPREAVMDTGRETFVFVKDKEGHFLPRKISVLLETEEYVAIAEEEMIKEEVVVGGNFMLDSESRLKAVIP